MRTQTHTPAHRRRRERRVCDAALLVLATLVVLGVLHDRAQRSAELRAYSSDLIVSSEISYKADLVEGLSRPPQLVFFGGSRSQRFDPAHARAKTGLRSFNLAVSNGRPEGAWALTNWLLARSPGTRLRWIWGVQWSTFYKSELDPGLLQDERFSWYFPDGLLRSGRTTLPETPAQVPETSFLRDRTYRADGLLVQNSYDRRRASGYTLDESLTHYIAKARRRHLGRGHRSVSKSRAQIYFEKTVRLLNDHGTTPVIVLMPVQPGVLAALSDDGLERGHRNLLAYLRTVSRTHRIRIVDISQVAAFDGDPSGFYDGVHMTRANSTKAMDAVLRTAAGALR